jgi:hypothetical protein
MMSAPIIIDVKKTSDITSCGRLESAETMDVKGIFKRISPSVPRPFAQ